jgi:hypothetical protein
MQSPLIILQVSYSQMFLLSVLHFLGCCTIFAQKFLVPFLPRQDIAKNITVVATGENGKVNIMSTKPSYYNI